METKLLIVSDLHLCRANRDDALAFIPQLAGIADPQVFAGVIFAGDNYDGCRADGAEQELARMIVGACNGIPAYGVSGNHDPGDVPLFVLLPIRQLAVNPVDIAGVKVAGVDYAPAADMRQEIEQAADNGAQLIVTHAGFEGWWHRNAHLLVDDVPTNVPVVFGDIHQHHRLDVGDGSGPRISVGSAYPCDAGEAGYPHGVVSLTFTDGILTDCRQIVLACRQYFKPEPAELDELIRRLQAEPGYPPAQLSLFRSDYRRAQQALGKTVRLMLRPAAQDNRPAAGAAAAIKRCDRRTALAAAVTAAGANPLAAQLAERLLDSQDPDAVIKAFVDDRLAGQPAVEPEKPENTEETPEDLF